MGVFIKWGLPTTIGFNTKIVDLHDLGYPHDLGNHMIYVPSNYYNITLAVWISTLCQAMFCHPTMCVTKSTHQRMWSLEASENGMVNTWMCLYGYICINTYQFLVAFKKQVAIWKNNMFRFLGVGTSINPSYFDVNKKGVPPVTCPIPEVSVSSWGYITPGTIHFLVRSFHEIHHPQLLGIRQDYGFPPNTKLDPKLCHRHLAHWKKVEQSWSWILWWLHFRRPLLLVCHPSKTQLSGQRVSPDGNVFPYEERPGRPTIVPKCPTCVVHMGTDPSSVQNRRTNYNAYRSLCFGVHSSSCGANVWMISTSGMLRRRLCGRCVKMDPGCLAEGVKRSFIWHWHPASARDMLLSEK